MGFPGSQVGDSAMPWISGGWQRDFLGSRMDTKCDCGVEGGDMGGTVALFELCLQGGGAMGEGLNGCGAGVHDFCISHIIMGDSVLVRWVGAQLGCI
jgi:hypothetical protein